MIIFAITLVFAIYTKHAWEDWYITYRCSKNLATGNGLVFTVGQRIHAFTSPLGTLIPAFLNIITLNRSDGLVLWLFRIIGCCLLGFTAILLTRISKQHSLYTIPKLFLLGMFGINIGIVDFSVNGMETAFMVFFIACIIYTMGKTITAPSLALGASWAGLMWTRPDGFVYIIGLALGYLLFYPVLGKTRSRTHLVKIYFFAGFILLVLYLPWTIWTWSYYKTIVPHTVIAKGLNTAFSPENIPLLLKSGMDSISKLGFRYFYSSLKSLYPTFMPPWYSYGDWGGLPWYFSKPLAFIAAYYWILPFAKPQIRAISFATWLGHLYLTYFANVAPWYIPSVTLLTIIVLSGIIQQAIARSYFLNQWLASAQKIISYAIASGIFLISLFLFLAGAYQLRLQQEIIETGHRKNIGLWLKGHANTSKDTVFLEPLGYIGFYSQLKMYDWPGLSSPEMILARKKIKIKESFGQLIEELKPDWLVLRPHEIEQVKKDTPILLETYYHIPKIFDVSDKIMAYKFLPGRGYLEFDQTFTVFRKNGI